MLRRKTGVVRPLMIDISESSTGGIPRNQLTATQANKIIKLMPIKIALVHGSEYS